VCQREVAVGAAAAPYLGENVNGDAWRLDRHDGITRIAVIDGLGHGQSAAEAAQLASAVLAASPELDPETGLLACHAALSHTRGAVMSIAAIDLTAGELTYAGIGNVEGRLRQSRGETRLLSYRGIIGATIGRVRSVTVRLEADWLLLMYTDGIMSRFDLEKEVTASPRDPHALASAILAGWKAPLDDATVVVAQPADSAS
jgi:serine phosphatase RsbU (regulator of sigma subunit)